MLFLQVVVAQYVWDSEKMEEKPALTGGRIYMAATPIGNVDDASPRLLQALATADLIAAEDTRRLHNLVARLGVELKAKVIAFHDHNETERAAQLLDAADEGQMVLVVSDAGTPTVSDPGFHLAKLAAERGVAVSPLPGPSAALAALSVSGLPTDRFIFEGFLPRKSGQAKQVLAQLATFGRTMIFFESPRRVAKTLNLMAEVFGSEREATVCRELTKTYEEVVRGTLGELAARFDAEEARGEITLVVSGHGAPQETDVLGAADAALALAASDGIRLKDAAAQVAKSAPGLRANTIYREALARKGD